MTIFYENAGIRIRNLREKQHLTREILSERAEISAKFLYEIEMGKKGFSAITATKLANALGTNCDYLLQGKTNREHSKEIEGALNLFDYSKINDVVQLLVYIHNLTNT